MGKQVCDNSTHKQYERLELEQKQNELLQT